MGRSLSLGILILWWRMAHKSNFGMTYGEGILVLKIVPLFVCFIIKQECISHIILKRNERQWSEALESLVHETSSGLEYTTPPARIVYQVV